MSQKPIALLETWPIKKNSLSQLINRGIKQKNFELLSKCEKTMAGITEINREAVPCTLFSTCFCLCKFSKRRSSRGVYSLYVTDKRCLEKMYAGTILLVPEGLMPEGLSSQCALGTNTATNRNRSELRTNDQKRWPGASILPWVMEASPPGHGKIPLWVKFSHPQA